MNWTIIFIVAALFVVILLVRRAALVSADVAKKHLAKGALVIDVRSAEEFSSGHLLKAVNIPLNDLRESVPNRVKDKQQVLLLHCLSGTRSGVARQHLKGMGYLNVFNLGSLTRARKIVDAERRGVYQSSHERRS